jgi:thioredoxin reductase
MFDAGNQSNLPAHGIGGLLGHDGRPPAELYAIGRAELGKYSTVEVRDAVVTAALREGDLFTLEADDGSSVTARHVLLATGTDYRYPDVPGLAERWGRSVFHCPFCHGWEVRDRPLGVLDRGAAGLHRALLLREWSDDVTVYSNGPVGLDDGAVARLETAGVKIDERHVVSVDGPGTELEAIVFDDGSTARCQGLLVPVTLHQHSDLPAQLGAELAPAGPIAAGAIDVDAMYSTSAPGVSAAGDAAAQMPSIAPAIAAGVLAATMVVRTLVEHRRPAMT